MKIEINMAALGRSRWCEYLVRFAFGGVVTVLAGIVAKRYGPGIGGLFLAFPAIFPATSTLLEKHERQQKERVGRAGVIRAREIAGVDGAGAAMGSMGLMVFALIVWRWLPRYPEALVLSVATVAWLLTSVMMWLARKTIWKKIRTTFFGKESGELRASDELSRNRSSHD